MKNVTCPFCKTLVPRGATVCKGCNAVVEYRTPPLMYIVLIVVSIFAGLKIPNIVGLNVPFASVIVGLLFFIFVCYLSSQIFASRIHFERSYFYEI